MGLSFGAGVSLTTMMDELQRASQGKGFEYLADAATYIDRVANLQVRNVCLLHGIMSTIKYYPMSENCVPICSLAALAYQDTPYCTLT